MSNGVSGFGVSGGAEPAPAPDAVDVDFKAAYLGGDDLLSRLQVISDERRKSNAAEAAAKAALAELNLGKVAKEAMEKAASTLSDAEKIRKAAEAEMSKAQALLVAAETQGKKIQSDFEGSPERMRQSYSEGPN